MTVEEYVMTKETTELEIVGATLLSVEEAKLIPMEEQEYDDWWWLRSPGDDADCAAYVDDEGYISSHGIYVQFSCGCVRPALVLKNIEKTDFQIGDIFEVNNWKFKIISDSLAWMYNNDIGFCAFRKDWEANDANIYEKSDVKKSVDKWFKELTK